MDIFFAALAWIRENTMMIAIPTLLANVTAYLIIRHKARQVIKEKDQRKSFFRKEEIIKKVGVLFTPPFTLIVLSNIKDGEILEQVNFILRVILFFTHTAVSIICFLSLRSIFQTMEYRYENGEYQPDLVVEKKWYKRWLGL